MSTVAAPAELGRSIPPAVKAKLQNNAQDFEAFYIQQFIRLMKPQDENTVFSGGVGEQMFRDTLHQELAKNIARQGGFGLGQAVYTELLKHQEAH
jgi:flagellar protein FlgJ